MKIRYAPIMGLLTMILAALACGSQGNEAGPAPDTAASARVYQVHGVLEKLPDTASGGQLRIRHEAIPDFIDSAGRAEGMASMTMPFPVAAELDLDGFSVGEPVRFELTVDWEAVRPVAITAIEKLPAEIELALD
jgi:hypothetical protein